MSDSYRRIPSYQGVNTTGEIREVIGLNTDITGRPVIIVEDIVDTGLTMAHMIDTLKKQNPASIDVCTLLVKPDKLQVHLDIRYCACRFRTILLWAMAWTMMASDATRRIFIR